MKKTLLTSALILGSAVASQAAFTLVEDFESHTLGAALDADAAWTAQAGNNAASNGTIVNDGGSQAAQILGGSNNGSYYTGLGSQTIANNTTGTVFFRFRSTPAAWLQTAIYLTDWQPNSALWYNNDQAGLYGRWNISPDGTALLPHHDTGGATQDIDGATWYNVWIVANNTANTYDLHLSQGSDDAIGDTTSFTAGTNIPFRSAADDLDYIFFADPDGNSTTGIVLDDIYVDTTGVNLTNAVPEPSSAALLGLGGIALILRRRK